MTVYGEVMFEFGRDLTVVTVYGEVMFEFGRDLTGVTVCTVK